MAIPYADIVILALIAGFILLRLRNILGQDGGFDPRQNQQDDRVQDADFIEVENKKPKQDTPNIPPVAKAMQKLKAELATPSDQALIDQLPISAKLGVEAIKKADPAFNLHNFLGGAKSAFEMVIKAFNDADSQVFNMLMKSELAQVFIQEANARKSGELKSETTLVSIASAEVKAAELDKKIARITLHILSEQISVVRNKQHEIIEGDPSHIERVEDEWVFERDTTSKNPNWMIVDT